MPSKCLLWIMNYTSPKKEAKPCPYSETLITKTGIDLNTN